MTYMLVMLMLLSGGPQLSVYPRPFASEAECKSALISSQVGVAQLAAKAKMPDVKTEFKCLQW